MIHIPSNSKKPSLALTKKGFTLIEILVALFIMLVGLSSAFALFAAATALHKRATDNSTAAILSDIILADISTRLTAGANAAALSEINKSVEGYDGYNYDIELVPVDAQDSSNANEFYVRLSVRWRNQGKERSQVFSTILNRRLPFKGREYYQPDD